MRLNRLLGPILLITLWYLLSASGIVKQLFLPWPHAVGSSLLELIASFEFWKDLILTVARLFIAFACSALIGIPAGLCMGRYRPVYDMSELLLDFFRSLPALALFPLFLLFFGIGDVAKIATAAFGCSLVIALNSAYGVTNAPQIRRTIVYLMGATEFEVFRKVVVPNALPQIFVGLRIALSLALIIVVVTEMFIGSTGGIGHRIYHAQLTYRVPEMYASIAVAGFVGYMVNKAFVLLERRIVHWSGT